MDGALRAALQLWFTNRLQAVLRSLCFNGAMRWLLSLVLSAVILPADAMAAGVAPDVDIEQIGQQAPAPILSTGSVGTVEQAAVDPSDAPETALLRQLGLQDASSVVQTGANDYAEVTQTGLSDRSTIIQTGANDDASVWQSSANAQSTITQTGANNIARVRQ